MLRRTVPLSGRRSPNRRKEKSQGILQPQTLQRDPGGLAQGFVDLDLGISPGWWAATVATYYPNWPGELPKFLSSKPCE